MINKFNELLTNLGIDLDILLTPEDNSRCSLKIDDKLIIQLQIDKTEENILVGSFISVLPPGKFRENIFVNTLKANGKIPLNTTFAFNEQSAELVLFKYLPLKELNVTLLKSNLETFIETAMKWKEALDAGQTAPIDFTREMEQIKPSIFNKPLI